MATTEDEWESLFRKRLENYESEPDEGALERILGGANPTPVAKPGGKLGDRIAWSLGVLAILGMLTFGVWQYQTLSAHTLTTAETAVAAKNEMAQPAVSPEAAVSGKTSVDERVANAAIPAETRTRRNSTRASKTVKPLVEIGGVRTAAFTGKKPSQPVLNQSALVMDNRQTAEDQVVIETGNRLNVKTYKTDEVNSTFAQVPHSTPVNIAPELVNPALDWRLIAGKEVRLSFPVGTLPTVIAPIADLAVADLAPVIEPVRLVAKPAFYASFTPLYTFRQVTPTLQDNVVMEKIRPAKSLSARTGYRIQAGFEFPISQVFGLRVSAAYQMLQQEMTYSARALRSDSSRVEWVDPQTIKLTPLYKSEEHHVKNTWQYVALSAEGRLRLNPGQTTGLRHYISAGGSVGYLIGGRSNQQWQPFLQASYGIERQLTNKLRLQVEPGILYNLHAINDNSKCFSVRPYSYGLVIGLRWQL
ncbi:hypothetical protein [Larkinella rosea]|uniref:Outer membrane protein beta-barrel domain-containing protein n=1 Tax=Larkinella rosea TaxID=2025312 RepID=A0A3P1BUU4_9BACT|nr:hypothetical protein [Larkinella rosea]RRB04878.1 hypothetical protein EHT25_15580 [Larkinella rosea]